MRGQITTNQIKKGSASANGFLSFSLSSHPWHSLPALPHRYISDMLTLDLCRRSIGSFSGVEGYASYREPFGLSSALTTWSCSISIGTDVEAFKYLSVVFALWVRLSCRDLGEKKSCETVPLSLILLVLHINTDKFLSRDHLPPGRFHRQYSRCTPHPPWGILSTTAVVFL